MARNIIIFLGPPGAGKGTLSRLCLQRLNYRQFSTGNVCRQHIADMTEIGKEIDFTIKSGKLISDSLIMDMVQDWLRKQCEHEDSIILDGIPRTRAQAHALHEMLSDTSNEQFNVHLIKMMISQNAVVKRLSGRILCSDKGCQAVYSLKDPALRPKVENTCDECSSQLMRRNDDEQQAIIERLAEYYKHENELIEFYKSTGLGIHALEVEEPIETVYERLSEILGVK